MITILSIKYVACDTKFTHEEKEQSQSKSEKLMHNKEQHEQSVAAIYKTNYKIFRIWAYELVSITRQSPGRISISNVVRNNKMEEGSC